tara:strand:+ start:951 stop:1304 length:354 start_codon:yes stop_codon:yes gene_type:complete
MEHATQAEKNMTLEEQECYLKDAYAAWGSSSGGFKEAAVHVYSCNDRATLETMLKNNAIDVSAELMDEIAKLTCVAYEEQAKLIRDKLGEDTTTYESETIDHTVEDLTQITDHIFAE